MRIVWIALAIVLVAAGAWFLSRPAAAPPSPPTRVPLPVPPPVPAGPPAAIEGEVVVTGAVPEPGKLHREADPYCARTPMTDPSVLVQDGKLANVWVHLAGAAGSPPPAAAVEMDQKDCMYTPRVTTAVVGQKIVARNGDPVLHNVHAYSGPSTLFNRGMPNEKAAPIETTAGAPGVISWKCDVHPWMRGYVGVSTNAFQAVTGADGKFRIDGVPAGHYTIEAWHERYGTLSQQADAPGRVTFTFAAR